MICASQRRFVFVVLKLQKSLPTFLKGSRIFELQACNILHQSADAKGNCKNTTAREGGNRRAKSSGVPRFPFLCHWLKPRSEGIHGVVGARYRSGRFTDKAITVRLLVWRDNSRLRGHLSGQRRALHVWAFARCLFPTRGLTGSSQTPGPFSSSQKTACLLDRWERQVALAACTPACDAANF